MYLTKLEKAFKDAAFHCGGVFLLRPADALLFLEEHRLAGIPVLGIEGFRVLDMKKIQPQQEHTADFEIEGAHSHEQAERFLRQRLNSGLWFEVVSANSSTAESKQGIGSPMKFDRDKGSLDRKE